MFGQIEFNEEEKIKLKKTILIIGGLVVFAIIISLYTSTFKNDAIKTIKINKSKALIYTTKEICANTKWTNPSTHIGKR